MQIVFATLHVRDSAQAVALAAGCMVAALPEGDQANATLIDLFPEEPLAAMAARILQSKPDIVAFPTYVWNRLRVVALARQLGRENPLLHLVAGGPEASGDPAGLAREVPGMVVMRGEGELGLPPLIQALARGITPDQIPGLVVFRDGDLIEGPPPLASKPGDIFPSPWLEGVLVPQPGQGVLWETARGCAFACDYCFDALGHEKVRLLDWPRLEAELELFAASGVSQVWVLDSTFNFPPERGRRLLELLLTKAPHLHYHLEAKAEFLDRAMIHLLGRLSCSVQIGLQTTNPAALKIVHRPLDLDHLSRQVHLLDMEGVIYGFDLIYGLPEDDYSRFCSSLDAALGFSPNHVHIFPLAVLPGTRLSHRKDRYQLKTEEGPPYEIIESASWSMVDLEKSRRLAAAVDLFYNTGRAVAFFPAVLKLFGETPSQLLEDFSRWLTERNLAGCQNATAAEACRAQQDYLHERLRQCSKTHLSFALDDLLNYHYLYAETLLGEQTLPLEGPLPEGDRLWKFCWQLAPQVKLANFTYEIVDLMDTEDFDLEEFARMFRPVGSAGLFLRRGNDVYCESLSEDFYDLLRRCDGSISPEKILAGRLPRATAEELVSFAVAEGLLQRSTLDR
ncbi:MAG TPA: DUF4080 domain-containing protein [Desulfuromonadales bacterium]|nr:DUF4080 domain-containing protein [Desulfuromonadales bacterium]